MAERLPDPEPARWPQSLAPDDLWHLDESDRLFRLYRSSGVRATSWHESRHWGPTAARFDHHPEGAPAFHPIHKVWYGAVETTDAQGRPSALFTALAERFQDSRTVPYLSRDVSLAVCAPARHLRLLDLESGWLTRAGGNAAISAGPRAQSRNWARAIAHTYPDLDGLIWRSSVYRPGLALVLWNLAREAFAPRPLLNRPLADISGTVLAATVDLGYRARGNR